MLNNQGGSGMNHREDEKWWPILSKGLPLVSIAALLIFCSYANPENNESNTTDGMKGMEQAEDKAALDISIPPLDKIVPIRTETATFALG